MKKMIIQQLYFRYIPKFLIYFFRKSRQKASWLSNRFDFLALNADTPVAKAKVGCKVVHHDIFFINGGIAKQCKQELLTENRSF